jgi:hypothetical protein
LTPPRCSAQAGLTGPQTAGFMGNHMESSNDTHPPSSPDSEPFSPDPRKTYGRKYLVNKLNYINFVDGTITATFRHQKFATTLTLQVRPLPCRNQKLRCLWTETENLTQKLQSHDFVNLLIVDGQKSLLIEPGTASIGEEGIEIDLPEKCSEINSRKIRRHSGLGIEVQLVQSGTFFQGTLIDFTPVSLHVRLRVEPPKTFQWINPSVPASVVLSDSRCPVFSGEFKILNQSCGQKERSFILLLTDHQISKFSPKKHRSTRLRLAPSPDISFVHPLSGQSVELKVEDLSGSGLSVEEDSYNSVLLPGLIIPEAKLVFADGASLQCKAQVIYRNECQIEGKEDRTKCGIAILDMKIEDQARLLGILNQVQNQHCYVSNQVNLDALWKFFFETGFIYPEKYAFIESRKDLLKDTYQKIYSDRPNIARHFVYQDNGVILAHMAMIRFYSKAWMIHHHAAQKKETRKGGLMVLSHISRYANELHRLYSAHLDFVFCYFRPDNRFPRRVFGGVAEHIDNPKGCSVDTFAYFHFRNTFSKNWNINESWCIDRACPEDLLELDKFIEHTSGGLMVPALDLEPGCDGDTELTKEFEAIGLRRERHIFSLKIKKKLKAVILANISDLGLNMSDLTNCFKVIVLDPSGLNRDILYLMLSMLCVKLQFGQVPVLIYPHDFAKKVNIPIEKDYNLWILNLQHLDSYFEFCKKLIPDF